MYLSTSTNYQIGASFTPSLAEPVELDSKTKLKIFIDQSSPILRPCNLHLKHHLGEENSLYNEIIKNARSPVTYILSIDIGSRMPSR